MEEFGKELDRLFGVSGNEELRILQFFGSPSTLEALVSPLSGLDINAAKLDFLKLLSLRPNIVNTNEEYETRRTALMVASSTGYTKAVELLIRHEADIFIIDAEGLSCLHLAVAGGHLDVVRVLLNTMEASYSTRTFVDLETTEGDTALMLACKEGHLEISKLLIEKNANMEVSAHGWNCLHFSARYGHHEVSSLIIEASRNLIDSTIRERGHSEVSSLLIQEFPQLRDSTTRVAAKCPPDDSGKTALMLASQSGQHDVVKLLLEHKASVMMTSEEGWNCLHYAARSGHFEVSKLILEACPEIINYGTIRSKGSDDLEYMDSNLTPLMLACRDGHERIVELLLKHKADVRMRTELGWNCLHYAGRCGHFEVSRLIIKACAEMINDRTENGNVGGGRTTLMLACQCGHEDVVKLLLEHEADVMIFSDSGLNCLHYAAGKGHFEVSKLIIESCRNVIDSAIRGKDSLSSMLGLTSLMAASVNGHHDVVRLLLEHKASVMMTTEDGWNCLHYATVLAQSSDLGFEVLKVILEACPEIINYGNIRSKGSADYMDSKLTPLMLACQLGLERVVDLLLEHKADVRMRTEWGWNCLHYAGGWGHFEVSKLILEACPQIIDYGTIRSKGSADLEYMNWFSPLMLACYHGHEDVVKLLLEHKADVMIFSDYGWNCFHFAASCGRFEVSKLILEACPEIINYGTIRSKGSGVLDKLIIEQFPQLRDSTTAKGQQYSSGLTALMLASQSGHHDVVKLLLEHKASVMMTCAAGLNCLHYAAGKGHFEVSKLIIESCHNVIDSAIRGKESLSSMLGLTSLMLASYFGHHDLVKLLLEHKASVMMTTEDGWNCLHYATVCARSSDLGFEVSKLILEACPEIINYGTIRRKFLADFGYLDSNLTPLMLACQLGLERVVDFLLEHKADVRIRTEWGWNCLHYAGNFGHFEVSRLIIKACAEMINDRTEKLGVVRTTLMLACENGHHDVVKLLLEHKASVMMTSEEGWNCLHYAARGGYFEMSKLIIEACPEIVNYGTIRSKGSAHLKYIYSNLTPLMLACEYGYERVVELLLEHKADMRMRDDWGWNCLHYAGRWGRFEVSKLIIEACPEIINYGTIRSKGIADLENMDSNLTPLMWACENGHEDVVKLLLEHKADVMIFSDYGWNCFHYAAGNGHFEVSKLILEACPEIINRGTLVGDIIYSRSSSISIPQRSTPVVNVKNKTGLMLACESGNEQVVRLLLDQKADVMVYSESGRNCLHYAAQRSHSEVSSLLIQEFPQLRDSTTRGAAKCPPNDSGKTALMLASQYGKVEVVSTLLSHKADVMLLSEEGCDVLLYAARSDDLKVLELIIEAVVKSVVDANSPWWQRTLIWASEIGHLSVVGMLLKYKIDVTLQNGDGHNCLHLAAKNGHFELLEVILAKDTEGFVNSTTRAGETSLMLAAQKGDVEVAKILLKYKASVLECDEYGWNCLHFAESKGNAKVMIEILNHPDLEKLVDSKTKAGRTALILAAENGYADVAKLLIHKNCNELLCDDEGFSCLHVAAKHGHREVLSHLLSEEGDEDYWDGERLWVGDIESKIRRLDPNSLLLTSKRLKLMEV